MESVDRCRILFVCVGNMCRSPMAEAIARGMGGDKVEAYSAGLAPAGKVAGAAVAALEDLGYSTVGLTSKSLADVPLQEMDVIVSLAGRQGLPLLPRHLPAHLEAWDIPDPCGEDDQVFLATARLLERRVAKLLPAVLGAMRRS